MVKYSILTYAVFFLKILSCWTQHATYELENTFVSEEIPNGIPNVLAHPWFEVEDEDIEDESTRYDFYDEEAAHEVNPILSRVKRRIFPGVGKALDRDRSDRNPWVRSRDGFDENNANAQVMTRDGPMGSDLLYELYPDLAPPNWKDRSIHPSVYNENILNPDETNPEVERARVVIPIADSKPTFKIERDVTGQNHSIYVEQPRKQKVRIPKKVKEEIAIFAEQHGSSAAVAHFNNKVAYPLKKNAVEKYIRRYKRRQERQRKRRLSRS